MTDESVAATKQDIQMLFEALNVMKSELKEDLEEKIDQSEANTAILIEDLRHDFLGAKKDQVSLHENRLERHSQKLDNHGKRIDILEAESVSA